MLKKSEKEQFHHLADAPFSRAAFKEWADGGSVSGSRTLWLDWRLMDTSAACRVQTHEPTYLMMTEEKQGADFMNTTHSDLYCCSFNSPSLYPSTLVILVSPERLSWIACLFSQLETPFSPLHIFTTCIVKTLSALDEQKWFLHFRLFLYWSLKGKSVSGCLPCRNR